jgi:hypothetical protein
MSEIIDWFNNNEGFVTFLVFLATLFLGWASGIFKALRKKPKFKIKVLPGPSICSVFHTGKKYEGYDTHRTAIALYLKITNIGNAPSNIDKIKVGYHWNITGISWLRLKYGIGWFWLKDVAIAIEDFCVPIGEDNVKCFPFLFQKSIMMDGAVDTYLEVGKNAIGVVYFEQDESWGASSPLSTNGSTNIKIRVYDSFSGSHSIVTNIPIVDIEEAKKYNRYFGETFATIAENKVKEKREEDV